MLKIALRKRNFFCRFIEYCAIICKEVDSMDYVAIDFETANANLTSPCSIGIVRVYKNEIYDEWYFLINPNEPFSDFKIMIHHITPDDVKDALTVEKIWPQIFELLNNQIVVCHNADFDISILRACINKYNLPKPNIKIACTLRLARKLWKEEVYNHRLNTLAGYLGVELDHHNALSDARVCYYIINRGLRMYQENDLESLYEKFGLKLKGGL
ncbi:MAG TPA: 3'-5' exonuclease [Bacilli bacterium]|nr:3'-5' exonuclease [Bacilli bacterium]HQA19327.1 3'-5' exonuclease [Bacilli bacterium]